MKESGLCVVLNVCFFKVSCFLSWRRFAVVLQRRGCERRAARRPHGRVSGAFDRARSDAVSVRQIRSVLVVVRKQ
jgi:hypothetical protein